MRNFIIITALVIFLTGCTYMNMTPPGKIIKSELLSKKIVLNNSPSKSVLQLRESLRYCGRVNNFTIYGTTPDCMPIGEGGLIVCDLYLERRGDAVMGMIEFMPNNSNTEVTLMVSKQINTPDKTLAAWEQFLQGKHKEVCPE